MANNSKFSMRQQRSRPPRICKAVDDSFRFVTVPFKKEMSWWTTADSSGTVGVWTINGSGSLSQIGNPLQRWRGEIGEPSGNSAFLDLTYDTIVNVLTILYIAKINQQSIFARIRIIANIELDKPFSTRLIEMPPPTRSGPIFIQILY